MDFSNVNLFDLASKRLQWAADRQRVTSENVANADVAGYQAKEVESFDSYLKRASDLRSPPPAKIDVVEKDLSRDLSGNNVVLEEQLLEASSANGQYRMATSLYRKAYEMVAAVVSNR